MSRRWLLSTLYCAAAPNITVPTTRLSSGVCIQQFSLSQHWLEMAINRAKAFPPSSSITGPDKEEMKRTVAQQRDQTLTLNP
jgi:hypothetical protein